MSGFKLIAIVPLKDCSTKFRKNLEIGFPYIFYNSYSIELNNDLSEIKSIIEDKNNSAPENLYSLKNGINVNFSAVVGKNGTGKSTIIELLYYFIYILGVKKEIIGSVLNDLENEHKIVNEEFLFLKQSIEIQKKIDTNESLTKQEKEFLSNDFKDLDTFTFELNQKYRFYNSKKKLNNNKDIHSFIKNQLENKIINIYSNINEERKKNEPEFENGLNLAVIYEFKNLIHEIKLYQNEITLVKHNDKNSNNKLELNDIDLKNFFYSISLNYSHHGLNSKILGKWINKLFHKNDAYTTPVVINPMRNEGNFDINHEMKLSKERLMSNAVFDLANNKQNLLIGKYKISKFIFSPKTLSPPFPLAFDEQFIDNLLSSYIFKKVLKIDKVEESIDYWDYAIAYLEKKIPKIDENYYTLIHSNNNLFDHLSELENFIINDRSHITKKVRQVINFLKSTFNKKNRFFWKMQKNNVRIELTPKKLLEWINTFNLDLKSTKPSELIEYALPGFFNVDFELENENGEKFEFGKLSSGEQQMIFNLNAILYHLYNIQSVHITKNINTSKQYVEKERAKYENVNIILDEVELYYHPEMQRFLVKNIMDSLENIKNKGEGGINSINICFLTHSPFILSDIPYQNTLLLKSRQDNSSSFFLTDKTFGTNIHDSLVDNFFMESTIGEYSRVKINEFVKILNDAIKNRNDKRPTLLKRSRLELELFGGEKFINLIGDTIVRDKLFQLYFLAIEESDVSGLKKYYEMKLNDLNN